MSRRFRDDVETVSEGAASPRSDQADPLEPTRGVVSIAEAKEQEAQDKEALAPGTAVGRYIVGVRLGAGGGGMVYEAHDPELDRRVALKLLRADDGSGEEGAGSFAAAASNGAPTDPSSRRRTTAQSRLLREAQAMARLAHPNVVAVFDVGTFRDRVFMAMELAEGGSLRAWLKTKPERSEVLRILLEAGEGLSAAHGAGFVHRDFKPDNVLLTKDLRAKVTDFGLVRASGPGQGAADDASMPTTTAPRSGGSALETPLTLLGTVMGTPSYMAPEQHDAADTDARTDQYAFAVTLYEGLYGERPFRGTLDELAVQKRRGLPPAPRGANVPPWQRRILAKALDADPRGRFASMGALLAALRADPAVRVRRGLAVAGAVLVLAGAVVGTATYKERARSRACQDVDGPLGAPWDGDTRAKVRASMLGSGAAQADLLWKTVEASLDGYASAWRAQRRSACEATRVRGVQPEAVLVLRNACLDTRAAELGALTRTLATADAELARSAPQAAAALTPLARCSATEELMAAEELPTDPAKRQGIEDVRKHLAEAVALAHMGRSAQAKELVEAAMPRAEALGYRPLQAEIIYRLATVLEGLGDAKGHETQLARALGAAYEAHDERIAANAAIDLAELEAYGMDRPAEGRRWIEVARAAASRVKDDDEMVANLLAAEMWVAYQSGDHTLAVDRAEKSAAAAERARGLEDVGLATFYNSLGSAYEKAHRMADAERSFEKSIALTRRLVGEEHPLFAAAMANMGNTLMLQEKYPEALAHLQRAVELYTRLRGEEHPMTLLSSTMLADTLVRSGRCDDATPIYRRAIASYDRTYGLVYSDTAQLLASLGACLVRGRNAAEGDAAIRRAVDIVGHVEMDPAVAAGLQFEAAQALKGARHDLPFARKLGERAAELYGRDPSANAEALAEVKAWLAAR